MSIQVSSRHKYRSSQELIFSNVVLWLNDLKDLPPSITSIKELEQFLRQYFITTSSNRAEVTKDIPHADQPLFFRPTRRRTLMKNWSMVIPDEMVENKFCASFSSLCNIKETVSLCLEQDLPRLVNISLRKPVTGTMLLVHNCSLQCHLPGSPIVLESNSIDCFNAISVQTKFTWPTHFIATLLVTVPLSRGQRISSNDVNLTVSYYPR